MSLKVASRTLTAEAIIRTIEIQPTKIHRKGEQLSRRNPASAKREENIVLFQSTVEDTAEFAEHVRWLVKLLSAKQAALDTLKKTCDITVFCGLFSDNGQGGFTLSSDSMAALHSLGIDVVFDFYA